MTPLERAAKDMAEQEGWIWDGPNSQMVESYASGQTGQRSRGWWRAKARLAALAFREPSEAMVEAAEVPGLVEYEFTNIADLLAENWRRMLDAALEEGAGE